jgi:ATP-dependent RNA helicase DDX55/SPB4
LSSEAAENEEGGTQKTPTGLHIQYMICEADQKLEQLLLFLREHPDKKIIVYFLTCSCVDFIGLALRRLKGPQGEGGIQKVHLGF